MTRACLDCTVEEVADTEYEMNDKTDLYFIVENMFDSEDIVARAPKNGIRTQRPRSFMIGLRYKL